MRKSGVLMHISSLPSPYGIGTVGKCAYEFVDFLRDADQACWQILPLSPTGYGDSPYQSFSTFGGNHYLIDLDLLVEEGLLKQEEINALCWSREDGRVDYGLLYENRLKILKKAFLRHGETEDFARFRAENDAWLPDYAAYMGLKEKFGGKPWYCWPEEAKHYGAGATAIAWEYLGYEGIQLHCFVQYLFFKQWKALLSYAHSKEIRIIGDVPIYVPLDSVEVWKEPQMFQLDENLNPRVVAGCPPDAFTADGQLWGNPIYDWDAMKADGYGWWIRRLAAAGKLYDVVRLDHFRGLESYWAIPYGDTTAKNGWWVKGPDKDFIRAVKTALPELDMIAEDLGYMTPEVRQLQEESGFPGMKVMQFAFDSREETDYRPHTYPVNSVCYTGTHDNLTLAQWFAEAAPEDIALAKAYLGLNEEEGPVWGMIRGCMGSVSKLCIIQMQDYLELGGFARMNFPGTLSGANWTWRAEDGFMTEELTNRIREITRRYGRA